MNDLRKKEGGSLDTSFRLLAILPEERCILNYREDEQTTVQPM